MSITAVRNSDNKKNNNYETLKTKMGRKTTVCILQRFNVQTKELAYEMNRTLLRGGNLKRKTEYLLIAVQNDCPQD